MRLKTLVVALVSLPHLGGCVWARNDSVRALDPPTRVQVFTGGARHEGVVQAVAPESILVGDRWIRRAMIDSVRTQRAHAVPYVIGFGVVLPVAVLYLIGKSMEDYR